MHGCRGTAKGWRSVFSFFARFSYLLLKELLSPTPMVDTDTAPPAAATTPSQAPCTIKPGNIPQSPAPPRLSSAQDEGVHPDKLTLAADRTDHSWSSCPGHAFVVRHFGEISSDYESTGRVEAQQKGNTDGEQEEEDDDFYEVEEMQLAAQQEGELSAMCQQLTALKQELTAFKEGQERAWKEAKQTQKEAEEKTAQLEAELTALKQELAMKEVQEQAKQATQAQKEAEEKVAQQEAERARFVVEKAMQDKKSTIIRAQGEAKSAKLIGDAVRDNPGFIELRKLEAARDIAMTVSKSSNRVFLDSHSLMLNVQDKTKVDMASRASPKADQPQPVVAAPAVA